MSERILSKDKAIKMFLSDISESVSGFAKGLKEARIVTGRDPSTGEIISPEMQGSWLGVMGYMALLDQIGTCFKPSTSSALTTGNSITKALKYFSTLSDDEINALYALRCAFAHDYSLYNIKTRPGLTHCFKVGILPGRPAIQLPTSPWSGDYHNKQADCHTIVSLQGIGDLVENICMSLFALANAGNLDVILQNGSDELLQRYIYIENRIM